MTPPQEGFPEELQPLLLAAMSRAGGPLGLWDGLVPRLIEDLSPGHPDAERLLADGRRRLAASLAIYPQPERTPDDE